MRMSREEMMIASAKAEIAIAAETLKTKIDLLKRIDSSAFNQLDEVIYESCDLNVNDALNLLYALTDVLNQSN
jgi:hypothetical protein